MISFWRPVSDDSGEQFSAQLFEKLQYFPSFVRGQVGGYHYRNYAVDRRQGEKREHFLECPLVLAPLPSQLPRWGFILSPWQMAGGSDSRPSWRMLDHPAAELCHFPSSPAPENLAQLKRLLVVPWGFCMSCSIVKPCLTLWPHKPKDIRLPCSFLSPWICSNSGPFHLWCQPTVSSSVIPFSSRPQSYLASESFSMKSTLHIRWTKYWSFSLSPSSEYSGFIYLFIYLLQEKQV